ncbi:MAG: hypothetical protein QGI15_05170 [Candidatus Scalindua sp.]|nr:hypothetical protein [Candidatus Scalindua sp.]
MTDTNFPRTNGAEDKQKARINAKKPILTQRRRGQKVTKGN